MVVSPTQSPLLRTNPCQLSLTAYLRHLQLPSVSGYCLLKLQPEIDQRIRDK
jgi:hypothetical protein